MAAPDSANWPPDGRLGRALSLDRPAAAAASPTLSTQRGWAQAVVNSGSRTHMARADAPLQARIWTHLTASCDGLRSPAGGGRRGCRNPASGTLLSARGPLRIGAGGTGGNPSWAASTRCGSTAARCGARRSSGHAPRRAQRARRRLDDAGRRDARHAHHPRQARHPGDIPGRAPSGPPGGARHAPHGRRRHFQWGYVANSDIDKALASRFIEFGNENSYSYKGTQNDGATYAKRFKSAYDAMHATNPAMGLLAQADDGNCGCANWVNGMASAVPNLGSMVAGWTVHPYGPESRWKPRIDRLIAQTAAKGWSSSLPIDITEWGISTDDGANLENNDDGPPEPSDVGV